MNYHWFCSKAIFHFCAVETSAVHAFLFTLDRNGEIGESNDPLKIQRTSKVKKCGLTETVRQEMY